MEEVKAYSLHRMRDGMGVSGLKKIVLLCTFKGDVENTLSKQPGES